MFGSGYLANCGIVTALVGRGDTVVADRLIHASLIDAVRMSGATLRRFRHNDAGHAAELLAAAPPGRGTLLVTEAVFSMDGDRAPTAALRDLARAHDALFLVDEAHAAGILPPAAADLSMGTLSKSYGGYGGYVCCDRILRDTLVNRARAFIYTTAPPPAGMAAARAAIALATPGRARELLERAAAFRDRLRGAGLPLGPSDTQIVPLMVGDNERALDLADRLRGRGVHTIAIRPPTVPAGTARLRLSIGLHLSEGDLERAATVLCDLLPRGDEA